MVATERQQYTTAGMHGRIPFSDYCRIQAVNWHTLEPYRVSAKEARHKMLFPSDASDAQRGGEADHAAILEPDRFNSDYVCMPDLSHLGHYNSKAYKDAKAKWIEENKHVVTLTKTEFDECRSAADAVRENPTANALVSGRGKNEQSITWTDRETGAYMKGRLDRIALASAQIVYPTQSFKPGEMVPVLADIKTTRAHLPGAFEKEIVRYGYHGQLSMYRDGLMTLDPTPITVCVIAIQNTPPFDVLVYRLDEDSLSEGRKLYRRLLMDHLRCTKEKNWPGAAGNIITAVLPSWGKEPEMEAA